MHCHFNPVRAAEKIGSWNALPERNRVQHERSSVNMGAEKICTAYAMQTVSVWTRGSQINRLVNFSALPWSFKLEVD